MSTKIDKKSIFIYQYTLDVGGIERSLLALLRTIDYNKYDVDLFLVKHQGEFLNMVPKEVNILPQENKCLLLGIPLKQLLLKGNKVILFIRLWAKFCFLFKKHILRKAVSGEYINQIVYSKLVKRLFRPSKVYDLALSFSWPHYYIVENIKAKVKVGWVHTDYSYIYLNIKEEKKMWDNIDYIACVSSECKNNFLSKIPELKSKVLIIENILLADIIRKEADDFYNIKEMNLLKEGINICSVGRFCEAKNFESIPEICRLLLDYKINIKWYIIGYGVMENAIIKKIKEYKVEKNVIILGKKINPYPYMKACDYYIQPSRFEGKSVAVREAQILGKPVIITNFPTAKSQIKDGYDGIIVSLNTRQCAKEIWNFFKNSKLNLQIINNIKHSDYSNATEIDKIYMLIRV